MRILNQDPQKTEVTGLSELIAANAAQVRDDIRNALPPSVTILDLDLSSVTFLDSSGLGALISLHKTLSATRGAVRILRPTATVRQILELTRLHRMFEIVTS